MLSEWLIERGRYAEALGVVERIVAARRAGEALPLAQALMSLGMVRDALGEPLAALPPLSEAYTLLTDHGAPAGNLGACADALGLAAQAAGELGDAEKYLRAAIEYRREASPESDEPWVSASRVHLGQLYLTTAQYEAAEPLLRQALATATDEATIAARARALAAYHHTVGAYSQAASLLRRALSSASGIWGESSRQVAAIHGDLGLAHLRAGESGLAGEHLRRCREIIEALPDPPPDLDRASAENLATYHLFEGQPESAIKLLEGTRDPVALNNLGAALQMVGQFEAAGRHFEEAGRLADSTLPKHHPLRVQLLQNLACLRSDDGDPEAALAAARKAGSAALQLLDGLLSYGTEEQRLAFRRTSDPLSLLCSFGAPAEEIAEMLANTKGAVLDSLLSDGGRDRAPRRVELPEATGFIDYAIYQHYLGRGSWEARYGAVVKLPGAATRWVELGASRRLQALLADLRAHILATAHGVESDAVLALPAVLQGLHAFCIEPLGELPAQLVMAPDAALRFVPFAALRHDGKFFCELQPGLRLVPSARSAAKPPVKATGWAQCTVGKYSKVKITGEGELSRALAALGDLPGVVTEREALSKVAPFRELPQRKGDLLESFAAGPPPRVLHFGCHGIFLGKGSRPMFRSGLVLAEKEVLFAGEIASLNLEGTQLVTLAACDTGLGESLAGEGVLGLQRGFQLAGARHILMTLWPVGDRELPELVADIYRRLAEDQEIDAALWSLQRERLARADDESLARAVWINGGLMLLGGWE